MKCLIEEVSICGKGRESRAHAWGCPRHPKQIIKDTQASKLGDAPEGIPSFFNKYISVCFRIRFVHAICASLGASFAFSFHFYFMHNAGMR